MSKSSKSRLYNPNHAIVSLGVFSAGESSSVVFLSCVKCRGKVKHRTEDAVSFPLFWAFQGSVVFCSVTPWGAGGNGGSGGRELQTPAVTHAGVGQKPTQSWKAVILQLKKQNRNENPQIFDVLSTEIWTLFVTTAYTNWLIFFLKDEPTQGYRGLILKQEGR